MSWCPLDLGVCCRWCRDPGPSPVHPCAELCAVKRSSSSQEEPREMSHVSFWLREFVHGCKNSRVRFADPRPGTGVEKACRKSRNLISQWASDEISELNQLKLSGAISHDYASLCVICTISVLSVSVLRTLRYWFGLEVTGVTSSCWLCQALWSPQTCHRLPSELVFL